MLSTEALEFLHKVLADIFFVQILPFSLDKTGTKLDLQTTFKELGPTGFIVVLEFLILVPVAILGSKICIDNSDNFAAIVVPILELLLLFYVVSYQYGFYRYRQEIVVFVNKYLEFEDSLGKQWVYIYV
jgi:hypothetical protein